MLSRDVRRKVIWLVHRLGGEVVNGRVVLSRAGRLGDAGQIADLVRAVVELATSIAAQVERGTLACLHENACHDDEYVRVAMLETLVGHHRGTPEADEACRLALSGHYDWLRVTGAGSLGDEGTACFRKMLEDHSHRVQIRRVSLDHVARRQGPAAEEIVLACLADSRPELVLRAVEMLGECAGTARSVEPLTKLRGTITPLGRAAGAAIERIQARLQNAAPGQLAIASTQAGEVSAEWLQKWPCLSWARPSQPLKEINMLVSL
mgnify:CR=1 FL=1